MAAHYSHAKHIYDSIQYHEKLYLNFLINRNNTLLYSSPHIVLCLCKEEVFNKRLCYRDNCRSANSWKKSVEEGNHVLYRMACYSTNFNLIHFIYSSHINVTCTCVWGVWMQWDNLHYSVWGFGIVTLSKKCPSQVDAFSIPIYPLLKNVQ